MRVKVTKRQFQILLDNFYILSNKGIYMVTNGAVINFLCNNSKK